MQHIFSLADRLTAPALRLIATLHLLFLATFIATLLLTASGAHAEIACTGQDIRAQLAIRDPAKLAAVEAEGAKVPNGKGIFWKIEQPGVEPSWLLGTMHVTDPRITTLSQPVQAAFDEADTVVIEAVDAIDSAGAIAALGKRSDLMMYTDDKTLVSGLSSEDRASLSAGLDRKGIPLSTVIKMKPWMLLTAIVLPACETQRMSRGVEVLDAKLGHDAKKQSKELLGLETMVEQMEAMASMPMEVHLRGLINALELGDRSNDVVETMIQLYLAGEINLQNPLLKAEFGDKVGSASDMALFNKTMIVNRNRNMADRAVPILDKGNVFIAVGALHLPGEEGLVELLRAKGYTLSVAH